MTGLVADRGDKRRVLVVCVAAEAAISLLLGTLVALRLVNVPVVLVLAANLGLVSVVPGPAAGGLGAYLVEAAGLLRAPSRLCSDRLPS